MQIGNLDEPAQFRIISNLSEILGKELGRRRYSGELGSSEEREKLQHVEKAEACENEEAGNKEPSQL